MSTSLTKNDYSAVVRPMIFRDVGLTLKQLVDDAVISKPPLQRAIITESGLTHVSLCPPNTMFRSASFDHDPAITWASLGRPRLIINLREFVSEETYKRIIDQSKEELVAEVTSTAASTYSATESSKHLLTSPQVWNCSAANDEEKYDVTQPAVRDWLLAILIRLLELNLKDDLVKLIGGSGDDSEEKMFQEFVKHQMMMLEISNTYSLQDQSCDNRIAPTDQYTPNSKNGEKPRKSKLKKKSNQATASANSSEKKEEQCSISVLSPFRLAVAYLLERVITKKINPILIHCRFGRDRTGIVVAFLITVLNPGLDSKWNDILAQEFSLSLDTVDASDGSKVASLKTSNEHHQLSVKTIQRSIPNLTQEAQAKLDLFTRLTLPHYETSVMHFLEEAQKNFAL